MVCILLAAGYATRMYPLTENFPKPLLEIKGKPILDWVVDDLASGGKIDRYVVISNHKFLSCFEKWAGEKRAQGIPVEVLDDGSTDNDHRLGAVKDIEFAIEKLGLSDDLLVLAGDNVMDFSFNSFVAYFEEKRTTCIMRYRVPGLKGPCKFGVATVDEDGRVLKRVEKPQVPESELAMFHVSVMALTPSLNAPSSPASPSMSCAPSTLRNIAVLPSAKAFSASFALRQNSAQS